MAQSYSDNAASTTTTASFDSDLGSTLSVAATTGYPAAPFYLAIKRGQAEQQVVKVTAVTGLDLTVQHVSGSTATHASGSPVDHVAPAAFFNASEGHIDAFEVHGAVGGVVGTTATQTLTNKTISGAGNTLSNIPQSAVTNLTTDLTNLRVKSYMAAATASLTCTTTGQDVPGATITFTTTVANTVALVQAHFDVNNSGGADTFLGIMAVDGGDMTAQAIARLSGRSAVSQSWAVTLAAAGSHTVKLRAAKVGTANVVEAYLTHTQIVVSAAGI